MSTKDLSRLPNNEIHSLLVEYGLPSIPVTDSTRKVLIAKLAAAITASRSNEVQIQADGDQDQGAEKDEDQGSKEKQDVHQEFQRFLPRHDLAERDQQPRFREHRHASNREEKESPADSNDPFPVVVEKIRGRRRRPEQVQPQQKGIFGSAMQNTVYLVLISIIAISIYYIIFK